MWERVPAHHTPACIVENFCSFLAVILVSSCPVMSCSYTGLGNLFTITGRMKCALSLAGRKIN